MAKEHVSEIEGCLLLDTCADGFELLEPVVYKTVEPARAHLGLKVRLPRPLPRSPPLARSPGPGSWPQRGCSSFVVGEKDDNGYVYIPEAGVSLQGQSSNVAWSQVNNLATALGLSVAVEFQWLNHEKAAMPNAMGSFKVN
jgi:hypothetical protein